MDWQTWKQEALERGADIKPTDAREDAIRKAIENDDSNKLTTLGSDVYHSVKYHDGYLLMTYWEDVAFKAYRGLLEEATDKRHPGECPACGGLGLTPPAVATIASGWSTNLPYSATYGGAR